MKFASAVAPRVDDRPDTPGGYAARATWPEAGSAPKPMLALKEAVRSYAREPSEVNASRVERAVGELRSRRAGAPGHPPARARTTD